MLTYRRLIRDQANKTLDVYVTRVRKHGSTMPDTVLPRPNAGAVNGAIPRMGTPQNDTSWAGWAISSFTNKIASASGDMQSKPNGAPVSAPRETRPSSVPPDTTRSAPISSSASTLHRQALKPPSAPVFTRTTTDQFFGDAQAEDDELDEAWGNLDEDSFFDAPSDLRPLEPASTFDDGGEPDFAGWLSAQSQAKSKAPLPKGLTKASNTINGPLAKARVTTTGSVGSGSGAMKLGTTTPAVRPKAVAPQRIDMKPKETLGDDEWGDAWD